MAAIRWGVCARKKIVKNHLLFPALPNFTRYARLFLSPIIYNLYSSLPSVPSGPGGTHCRGFCSALLVYFTANSHKVFTMNKGYFNTCFLMSGWTARRLCSYFQAKCFQSRDSPGEALIQATYHSLLFLRAAESRVRPQFSTITVAGGEWVCEQISDNQCKPLYPKVNNPSSFVPVSHA